MDSLFHLIFCLGLRYSYLQGVTPPINHYNTGFVKHVLRIQHVKMEKKKLSLRSKRFLLCVTLVIM